MLPTMHGIDTYLAISIYHLTIKNSGASRPALSDTSITYSENSVLLLLNLLYNKFQRNFSGRCILVDKEKSLQLTKFFSAN